MIPSTDDAYTMSARPAPYPCSSCPYRLDVPSGVWEAEEYLKLPPYDRPTAQQPTAAFLCHQRNGRLCSGWVGCHDMNHSLAVRIAGAQQRLTPADVRAVLAYVSPVALHPSGAAAAAHGLRELRRPGVEAQRTIQKLRGRAQRQATSRPRTQ